jgi:hypothetical protein
MLLGSLWVVRSFVEGANAGDRVSASGQGDPCTQADERSTCRLPPLIGSARFRR